MKRTLIFIKLGLLFLLGFGACDLIDCGPEICDTDSDLGCCDDYGKDYDEKHCVPKSLCQLKGNKWAWLVTLISFLALAAFVTTLCVAKVKMYRDRTNYFKEEDYRFEKLDEEVGDGD